VRPTSKNLVALKRRRDREEGLREPLPQLQNRGAVEEEEEALRARIGWGRPGELPTSLEFAGRVGDFSVGEREMAGGGGGASFEIF